MVKNMIIYESPITYESYAFSDFKQLPIKVKDGVVLISNVAPFIDALKFSWMDLHMLKELREQELNIDFDKWLTLLKKEQELDYISLAVDALKKSLVYEAYLNYKNEMQFSFELKFGNELEDPVAYFYNLLEEGKAKKVRIKKFDNNNQWKIKDDELVTSVEGVELKISKDKKDELFKRIADHINQHLDNTIENIDQLLKDNKYWSVLCHKENQEKIVELFNKEKESNIDNVKEIREEASKVLTKMFGLTVSVW